MNIYQAIEAFNERAPVGTRAVYWPTVSDDELIQAVADLWVENGGDAEGFGWVQRRIREEIERREEADHE